jgi:hypothetical protein
MAAQRRRSRGGQRAGRRVARAALPRRWWCARQRVVTHVRGCACVRACVDAAFVRKDDRRCVGAAPGASVRRRVVHAACGVRAQRQCTCKPRGERARPRDCVGLHAGAGGTPAADGRSSPAAVGSSVRCVTVVRCAGGGHSWVARRRIVAVNDSAAVAYSRAAAAAAAACGGPCSSHASWPRGVLRHRGGGGDAERRQWRVVCDRGGGVCVAVMRCAQACRHIVLRQRGSGAERPARRTLCACSSVRRCRAGCIRAPSSTCPASSVRRRGAHLDEREGARARTSVNQAARAARRRRRAHIHVHVAADAAVPLAHSHRRLARAQHDRPARRSASNTRRQRQRARRAAERRAAAQHNRAAAARRQRIRAPNRHRARRRRRAGAADNRHHAARA